MWKMVQKDILEDYVIATGTTYRVRDFVAKVFAYADILHWEEYVEVTPSCSVRRIPSAWWVMQRKRTANWDGNRTLPLNNWSP